MRSLIVLFLIGFSCTAPAQQWFGLMEGPNPNLFVVQQAYHDYYQNHLFVKNRQTQAYKRWVRKMEMFANAKGYYEKPDWSLEDQKKFMQLKHSLSSSRAGSSWQAIGPFHLDLTAAGSSYAPGITRMNTVQEDPNDPATVYVGTATSGLWKSTDTGNTWQCLTLDMMVKGVGAVCIDWSNSNTVFFGSSIGIQKSMDGGQNWSNTSLTFPYYTGIYVWEIRMDPNNHNILLAATNSGFYRSTDGGQNWTQLMSGIWYEIEYHPSLPNIVYALHRNGDKCEFWKSTDSGINWNHITNGTPDPATGEHNRRSEISVSPAAPNNVYLLAPGAANGSSGLYGFYISTDTGNSFTRTCCGALPAGPPDSTNLNTMAWQPTGLDEGGQFYYDLSMDVSDSDPGEVYTGGINIWRSQDSGKSFTCNAKWTWEPQYIPRYVHADVHDIKTFGNHLWAVSDGGAFLSTDGGHHFRNKTWGINGTEIWGFGEGFRDGNVMIIGTYHNGTLVKDNDVYDGWLHIWGGDTYQGFVNFMDPTLLYGDYAGKARIKLYNDRSIKPTRSSFNKGINSFANIAYDPRNPYTIYTCADSGLWKSTNNAESWQNLINFHGGTVTRVRTGFNNPDKIYICYKPGYWSAAQIWRSDDGGQNWTNVTPPASLTGGQAWRGFDLAVASNDADVVWASINGYHSGYKVFKSTNGGQNWIDYSGSLPEPGVVSVVYQRGSNGGVYVGTDLAVYYRDNSMNDWQLYAQDLPISNILKLQIFYKEGKIRAATNGRGVWESNLFKTTAPEAQIAADRQYIDCEYDTIHFFDHSALDTTGSSWAWSFPGGIPASSNLQDPIVSYSTPGDYDVTLTVTNAYGSSTQTLHHFIHYINPQASLPFSENFESGIFPPINWKILNPDKSVTWKLISLPEGPDCQPTQAAYMNHFGYNHPGQLDNLQTPQIDLSGIKNPVLNYNYAYARWGSGYEDGFKVLLSTDCGQNWTSLYDSSGIGLTTTTNQQNSWIPTCSEWDTVQIDLSAWHGQAVKLRFQAINGWGNNFYIDNINLGGQLIPLITATGDTLIDFGQVDIGQWKDTLIGIRNAGAAPLNLNVPLNSTFPFSVINQPDATILPGDTSWIKTRFNAAGPPGIKQAGIVIQSNDSTQTPFTIYLNGESIKGLGNNLVKTNKPKIGPNPNRGYFFIENPWKTADMTVVDVHGKLIYAHRNLPAGNHQINLPVHHDGIYFLVLKNDMQFWKEKLIIVK